jgi:subtilisin family serine protease
MTSRMRVRRFGKRAMWLGLLLHSLGVVVGGDGHAATEISSNLHRSHPEHRLIVKFESEGTHAIDACAQSLSESGLPFADAARDGSDSLDRLHRVARPRRLHALFRVADGSPLPDQRAKLNRRLARRIKRLESSTSASPRRQQSDIIIPDLSHIYVVEFDSAADRDIALAGYRTDDHVAWAQIDAENELDEISVPPDDPFFDSSGSWGQPYLDLWGLHRVRAPEAWPISQGAGVIVAVVDTGLDYEHPDIADNVWINPGEDLNGNGIVDESDFNGLDDDANGFIDDLRGFNFADSVDANMDGDFLDSGDVSDSDPFDGLGHGSHVSGTIAAVADNGLGIAGVAPLATIMPVKGFTDEGVGVDSRLWRSVLYGAENGASIINTSWSCRGTCPYNPLAETVVAIVHAMDVVIVTSAGNSRDDVANKSPENLRDVITVSSTGEADLPSETFTNFGYLVDLSAPGGGPPEPGVPIGRSNILSLLSSGEPPAPLTTVGEEYRRRAGTSMSTPHVAGVVALLRSFEPDLDYEAIRSILRRTPKDLGPPGHDRDYGAGRLDAFAALTHPPVQDAAVQISVPRQVRTFRPQDGDIEIRGRAGGRDLLGYTLSYGLGTTPVDWIDFFEQQTPARVEGVLGSFPASELEEGSYVIRVQGDRRDGSILEEFLLLSLERNTPTRISSAGPGAARPDVSGHRVIWQSSRDPVGEAQDDENLFQTNLRNGKEQVVQFTPGDQTGGVIGRRTVAWLDDRLEPGREDLYGCSSTRVGRECKEFLIAEGPISAPGPSVAAEFIYWIAEGELHGCRPRPGKGRCDAIDLGLEPGVRRLLQSDGKSLIWFNPSTTRGLSTCRVDRKRGSCNEVPITPAATTSGFPAVSDAFVAWASFGPPDLGDLLRLCARPSEKVDCSPIIVPMRAFDVRPQASGRRLVFESRLPDQSSDVFFCEYDSILNECPVQRVTANATAQSASMIDAARIVWEDERDGDVQVFGIGLPSLRKVRDRTLREGQQLSLSVVARHPDAEAMVLSVEAHGAESAEDLGIVLKQTGPRHGVLRWRPDYDQSGSYLLSVSAATEGGLYSRETFRVEVIDRMRGRARARH